MAFALTENKRAVAGAGLAVLLFASTLAANAQVTVSVPADTVVTTTKYVYYPEGGVKTITSEPSAAADVRVDMNYVYKLNGVLESATTSGFDGAAQSDRKVTTAWDATSRYPVEVTNPKGHVERRTYSTLHGAPDSAADANGVTVRWEFDALGRKIKEKRGYADSSTAAYTDYTQWDYVVCATLVGGCPAVQGISPVYYVAETIYSSAGAKLTPSTKKYYDALGREVRSESEIIDSGAVKASYQDKVYDDKGRLQKVSLPYLSGSTAVWTTFEYDDLGRKTKEVAPNGVATSVSYTASNLIAWETTTVNALEGARATTVKRNSQGKEIEVVDAHNRATYFSYSAHGLLAYVVDAYGNTAISKFDVRGRKTQTSDPDMGLWKYQFNSFGELYSQTDAKGQVIKYGYDSLGRMVSRVDPGVSGVGLSSSFEYDTAANGKGKIYRATASNGYCRTHEYDAQGRGKAVTVNFGGDNACAVPTGGSFKTSRTYDSAGRLDTEVFPTGVVLKTSYNATIGFPEKVQNYTGGAAGATYWQWQQSDAAGRITQFVLGNNVSTQLGFDPSTTWLRKIRTGSGGNALLADVQSAEFDYDSIGNITRRADKYDLPNLVEKASHDLLGRLTSYARYDASGTVEVSGSRVSIEYDWIGNITKKSDTGTYYYNASGASSVRPHAVVEVRGAGNASYRYDDANGNMTSGGGRTMAYTSSDMLREVSGPGNCHRFSYQSERMRAVQTIYGSSCAYANASNKVSETYYVHPDAANGLSFERELRGTTQLNKHYITVGGSVVGVLTTTGSAAVTSNATGSISYFHYDHLGSVVALTNASGGVIERRSYDPWGRPRKPDGSASNGDLPGGISASTDRGYTLHEHLEGVGLIHMNGRVYDHTLARFLTPDPFVPDPVDMQSYNRYAYVRNRPLGSTDPTGYVDTNGSVGVGLSIGGDGSFSLSFGTPGGAIFIGGGGALGQGGGITQPGVPSYARGGPRASTTPGFLPIVENYWGEQSSYQYGSLIKESVVSTVSSGSPSATTVRRGVDAKTETAGVFRLQTWEEIRPRIDPTFNPMVRASGTGLASLAAVAWGRATGNEVLVSEGFEGARGLNLSMGQGLMMAMSLASGGKQAKAGVPGPEFAPSQAVTGPYVRPSGAGPTAAQRASVQGKPCVDCGTLTGRQVADHIEPLVVQHYRTGSVNVTQQRSLEAVQPHCPPCSAVQGGQLGIFSRLMKDRFGF